MLNDLGHLLTPQSSILVKLRISFAREVEKDPLGHVFELSNERNMYKLHLKSYTKSMRKLCLAVMVGGSSSSGSQRQAKP